MAVQCIEEAELNYFTAPVILENLTPMSDPETVGFFVLKETQNTVFESRIYTA